MRERLLLQLARALVDEPHVQGEVHVDGEAEHVLFCAVLYRGVGLVLLWLLNSSITIIKKGLNLFPNIKI